MKKILLSSFALLAVAALAAGVTYAFFTSNKTVTGNTFTAGTLVVDLKGNNTGDGNKFDLGTVGGMAPGEFTQPASIEIGNTGNLDLGWFGYFEANNWDANVDMTKVIYFKMAKMEFLKPDGAGIWEPTDQFITDGVGSGPYPAWYNTLAGMDDSGKITLRTWIDHNNGMGSGNGVMQGALKPNYKYRFTFQLGMLESANNDYQGKSMDLSYKVIATQVNAHALDAITGAPFQSPLSNQYLWMTQQIAKQR